MFFFYSNSFIHLFIECKQEGEETVYADWDSPQVELVADIAAGEVGRSPPTEVGRSPPAEIAPGEVVGLERGARARVLRQAGGRNQLAACSLVVDTNPVGYG